MWHKGRQALEIVVKKRLLNESLQNKKGGRIRAGMVFSGGIRRLFDCKLLTVGVPEK